MANPVPTYNYLVPADGTTHAVPYALALTGNPYEIDFRAFQQQFFKFRPQGAIVDNSLGTAPLVISIPSVLFNVAVPVGCYQTVSIPSPDPCVLTITGNGNANVIFVDYPVITTQPVLATGEPVNGNVTVLNNPLNTADVGLDAIISALGTLAANGLTMQGLGYGFGNNDAFYPHHTQCNFFNVSITGAATSGILIPAVAGKAFYLKSLRISLSANATLAAAGNDAVSLLDGSSNLWTAHPYVPAAVAGAGDSEIIKIDNAEYLSHALGNALNVTLATALSAGYLDAIATGGYTATVGV